MMKRDLKADLELAVVEANEGWQHAIERALKAEAENERMREAIMQLDRAFSRGKNIVGAIHRCFMAANGFEYHEQYKTMEERALKAEAEVESLRKQLHWHVDTANETIESLREENKRLKAEVEQLREIISTECPAGAFDIVTSLRAERELYKEQIAELKAEVKRLREVIDNAFCYLQIDPRKSIEILRREFVKEENGNA